MAKRAIAFGLKVIFSEMMIPVGIELPIMGQVCRSVSMSELMLNSDIISFHIPSTKETSKIINKEFLSKLKKNCILVNTSRGELVNQPDLIEFLKNNKNFKYGTDVVENEPSFQKGKFEHPFALLDNVQVTCHIGASTKQAEFDIGNGVVENLVNFKKYKKFLYAVNEFNPKL